MNRAGGVFPELHRRYLHLMLAGLRAHPEELPLPISALTTEQTHVAMGREDTRRAENNTA